MRGFVTTIACAALALAAGCAKPPTRAAVPEPYTGPTEPLDVVLARINANSGRITTLRGAGDFEATLPNQKPSFLNGTFTLLHTKPNEFRLDLNKPGLDVALPAVMRLGVNDERYWLSIFPEADTTWFGTVAAAPESAARLPLDPTLLADVLGVATLNTDLLAQPIPMVRFNPGYDAYMLTWARPIKDRWAVLREVWYKRETMLPERIWLFDRDGRVQLSAVLSDFRPLTDAGEDAPRVARRIDLLAPRTGSRLSLRFTDLRPTYRGAPNRISYRFEPAKSGTDKTIDLDQPDAAPAGSDGAR